MAISNPTSLDDASAAPGMRTTSIRLPAVYWEAIKVEAAAAGLSSTAAFIREASIARAVAAYEARGGEGNPALDLLLGRPRSGRRRHPVDAKSAYAALKQAAEDALEVREMVPRERQDLMTILRLAEARAGMVREWPGGEG